MPEIREIAERVLFADTLDEKLRPGPPDALDAIPGPAIALPDAPGRPDELRIRGDGVRVAFPGTHHLDRDRERGVLLHFLANHELLAAELMALVLLRFPDAPSEYRAGVYEAMREEQAHARMYLRRMRDCGVAFGELPVNDHFWRLIAPMATPLDFVTRLNLTFEQANLDFSLHYAGLFRKAGDEATAGVLEKIHRDEIGHVGHGVKWFRRWKDPSESDWQAFRRCLTFPLTPARAKGLAPFDAPGRRLAGLDEDFIRHLEVFEHSRGRTPVVHWFNPNAEAHARQSLGLQGAGPWQPDKSSLSLEADLESLLIGCCRKDDAILLRRPPSLEFLAGLKTAGYEIPEILSPADLAGRKLGGFRPWAWSPDASRLFEPHDGSVAPSMPHAWRAPLPAHWLSKAIGLQLESALGPQPETGALLDGAEAVEKEIERLLSLGCQALLKAPFSQAGRGHLRVGPGSDREKSLSWVRRTLRSHGALVVEPWLDRALDFSALYEVQPGGRAGLLGFTRMENDPAGRFLGIHVAPKWGSLLPPDLAAFLYGPAGAMQTYQQDIPQLLPGLLPGYAGPAGVDAMVHRRSDGSLALKRVVELNVRCTMGRVAWEWMKRGKTPRAGRLRILRRPPDGAPPPPADGIYLNDPQAASRFLACWTCGGSPP